MEIIMAAKIISIANPIIATKTSRCALLCKTSTFNTPYFVIDDIKSGKIIDR